MGRGEKRYWSNVSYVRYKTFAKLRWVRPVAFSKKEKGIGGSTAEWGMAPQRQLFYLASFSSFPLLRQRAHTMVSPILKAPFISYRQSGCKHAPFPTCESSFILFFFFLWERKRSRRRISRDASLSPHPTWPNTTLPSPKLAAKKNFPFPLLPNQVIFKETKGKRREGVFVAISGAFCLLLLAPERRNKKLPPPIFLCNRVR